jgi:regulator of nucleoside diphosphate kinase
MARKIIVTEEDKTRLQKIVSDIVQHSINGKEHVRHLEAELENAKVVAPGRVPPDVVTMNSKVLLSIGDSEEDSYTLVYPKEADFSDNKISVLAPIGTAILGYKEGDIVKWAVPDGVEEIRVIKILYQPESSGDFEL